MRNVCKEVVAVSFPSPKVQTVFGSFLLIFGIEALAEAQHNNFPKLKFKVLAREEYLVARDESEDALVVLRQLFRYGNPRLAHRP